MTSWLDSKAAKRLSDDLKAIPALFADLPAVKTGIKDPTNGTHTPPASKPPLSIEVITLLDNAHKGVEEWHQTDPREHDVLDRYGVIPHIGLWVRITIELMTNAGEHPPTVTSWSNLTDLLAAIKAATPWIITQQWSTKLAADLSALRSEIETALGIAKEFKPRCRNLWCGTLLEPMDNGSWYSCPGCKRKYVVAADLRALGGAQYMTSADVAQLLDVAYTTVRYWKTERFIRPMAYTAAGVELFDLDQVKAVRDTPPPLRVRQ
jgi:hypothetical protein